MFQWPKEARRKMRSSYQQENMNNKSYKLRVLGRSLENGENRAQNRSSIDSIDSIDIISNKAKLNDIPLESWDRHPGEPSPAFTSSPNLNLKEKADFYSGYWHCKTCSHKDDGPGMKAHICKGVKK
jgi:hypothetical protein